MDEEDEAWVYKHMRSGMEETVPLADHAATMETDCSEQKVSRKGDTSLSSNPSDHNQTKQQQNNNSIMNDSQQQQQHIKVLKPRNSDAILSCPCCFTILCMDCQRHTKYVNQYRA
eukprot:1185928-Ditylum_brightwellii.AAC.1